MVLVGWVGNVRTYLWEPLEGQRQRLPLLGVDGGEQGERPHLATPAGCDNISRRRRERRGGGWGGGVIGGLR